jgi:hypothetical protein
VYLVAFKSTQQGLLAEKRLKKIKREYKIIPTPRDVDTSCSVSILTDDKDMSWIGGAEAKIYLKNEAGKWEER